MKKIVFILFFLSLSSLQAQHHNLIVLVDTTQQETVRKQDVTATHQLIVALQQQAAPVLVSVSLWKNIVDRKKEFTKKLQDSCSIESAIYNLYQETNRQLKFLNYDVELINKKLSSSWYADNYQQLGSLPQAELNQLKFNFLSYNCDIDTSQWRVYNAQTGMLLFVPVGYSLNINDSYQVIDEVNWLKNSSQKSQVIQSMQTFFDNNRDEWIIYLSGHGHPQNNKQKAHIAGMSFEDFSDFLLFLNNSLTTTLLVYSSCYGGGVHTVEPYQNMRLNYAAIVVALTDAPIYGFGFFEGVKLPPYNSEYILTSQDIQPGIGLLQSATQRFDLFFKRAWSGLFDMKLVELVSQFFVCKAQQCSLQKIENVPLLRKANASCFLPMQDEMVAQLVQQVTSIAPVMAEQPLLLYVKKVEKIELLQVVPIVSMLPGLQNHEIEELAAHAIPLSQIINGVFLALSDAQKNKNYLIDSLYCYNDLIESAQSDHLTHFMLIQEGFMPKFLDVKAQALVVFKSGKQWCIAVWNNQKCSKILLLTADQIQVARELESFMRRAVNFQVDMTSDKLVEFDAYIENKIYQHDIIESCLYKKVCKKW